MSQFPRILVALSLLAVPSVSAWGDERVFSLDAGSSKASFVVGSTLHKVHGTLFLRSGEVRFDTDSGKARGQIVVDATRTETGNTKRDKKMHGKVLESARYPTFVFRPEFIEGHLPENGRAEIELRGAMSIHGESHPMTLPVSLEIDGDRVEARVVFSVPYVEWGLNDPSGFLLRVAKVVEVTLEIRGSLVAAPTSGYHGPTPPGSASGAS